MPNKQPEPTKAVQPSDAKQTSEAKQPSKYQSRLDGFLVTIGSLDAKLAELAKRRQNKKEKMRGVTEGGSSTQSPDDDAEKDLEAQITALSEQKLAVEAQKNLNQIFDEAYKNGTLENKQDDQKGGGSFKCSSEEDAEALANKIADNYEKLGFKCNISRQGNRFKVNVSIPKELEGKDPLAMSPEELSRARELKDKNAPSQSPKPVDSNQPFCDVKTQTSSPNTL